MDSSHDTQNHHDTDRTTLLPCNCVVVVDGSATFVRINSSARRMFVVWI